MAAPVVLLSSAAVRRRMADNATDRIRVIGPHYQPEAHPEHAMVGDAAEWFDAIVHQRTATSVTFLR
jgi:hypothetical protein